MLDTRILTNTHITDANPSIRLWADTMKLRIDLNACPHKYAVTSNQSKVVSSQLALAISFVQNNELTCTIIVILQPQCMAFLHGYMYNNIITESITSHTHLSLSLPQVRGGHHGLHMLAAYPGLESGLGAVRDKPVHHLSRPTEQ